jgi:type IV secretory pathway TrbD component
MTDQLMILAESGTLASEGLSAPAVGIGMFIILMALLGLTWLVGGAHHRSLDKKSSRDSDH